ncbi:MAG: glutathione S-transferase family protein [Pseudomonadota bacterium]
MKLFHAPTSPYVRKVVVLLHELNCAHDVGFHTVATTAFASDEGLKAANPLARLPALERDDGATLYDSRVITAYLNDLFDGTFYPQGADRWEVLTLEATGDGIMDSAVSMAYETRLRPKEEQSSAWVEAQWEKINRSLGVLNTRWMSHLSGPLTMGQISVGCALSYLNLRHGERQWQSDHTQLASWHAAFESRPSMIATQPPDT